MKTSAVEEFNTWHDKRQVDMDVSTPWHSFVIESLASLDLKGKRILEIGCGRGGFACWFARKYGDVYQHFVAADFSETAVRKGVDYAKNINVHNIDWVVKDITEIEFPSEYFDIVISCETIEHVPKPYKAIRELYRVMKKDGTLILTTPNYFNFFGLYRIYLRLTNRKWTELGQPINNFVTIPSSLLWLKNAGFKVVFFGSKRFSYPSLVAKKEVFLAGDAPSPLKKWFGLNSFFLAKKARD